MFLSPGLFTAAADISAIFCVMSSNTAVSQMRNYYLMHSRHMDRGTEDGI
jgi:hypothetical protein